MARAQGLKNLTRPVVTKAKQPPVAKTSKRQLAVTGNHVKHSIPQALRRVTKVDTEVVRYVLDTNVLLTTWEALFKFEEHDVCITEQVWAELDRHKTGSSLEAFNARETMRQIEALVVGKTPEQIKAGITLTPPEELVNGKPHTGKLFLDFSKPELPEGTTSFLNLSNPDDRIIAACHTLKKEGQKLILVSNDSNCRVKALMSGIVPEAYLSDTAGSSESEETLNPGFHHMALDFWTSAYVSEKNERGYTEYTFDHESLVDVHCNEFLIIPNSPPLRVISKSSKHPNILVAATFVHHKALKEMGLNHKNEEQTFATQLLLTTSIPGVSLAGQAGSGKTYLTLVVGLYLLKNKIINRIIFTRSMQGADVEIGFLPGDEAEKMGPWMGALWDNVSTILKIDAEKPLDKQPPDMQEILSAIKVVSLNFMKGRSIDMTLIIVDECQDLKHAAMKMIGTRVGTGSKIVFLGNVAQIDNPTLTKHTCGLTTFIKRTRTKSLVGHVTLQKGERSAFATMMEEIM